MPTTVSDLLAIPAARRTAMEQLVSELGRATRVAISTHMNADGDGCGSETALARILASRGIDAWIVNPTPWPPMFTFLLGSDVKDRTREGAAALAAADTLVVLDISDVKRLGVLADSVRKLGVPKLVIDHHIPSDEPPGTVVLSDTSACATGELVFDLATAMGVEITEPIARALYAAILTDTGGFRYSNTAPRAHAIAAKLLAAGVEPEEMYRRIYASVPLARIMLLRDALATLDFERGLDLGAGRRARALRPAVGGSRRARGAPALDRRNAPRPLLPRPRARQGEGVVPQHGRRRRESLRARLRRRRPREGRRRAGRRSARRGADATGAGRAGVRRDELPGSRGAVGSRRRALPTRRDPLPCARR
jgi:DHH family